MDFHIYIKHRNTLLQEGIILAMEETDNPVPISTNGLWANDSAPRVCTHTCKPSV